MVFKWKDLNRIGKKTFYDIPKAPDEIKQWTSTLFLICTTAKLILRNIQTTIESDPALYDGVFQMLKNSIQELSGAAGLFPQYDWEKFFDEVLMSIYETTGYVKIIGGD